MKIKNIFLVGLASFGMASCNDYLETEAPSKLTDDYVFATTEEANRLLNGVYQATCSDKTYGNAYLTTFCLNSDVEFTTSSAELKSASHNEWKLFDGEADGSGLEKTWNAVYAAIERANNFVNAAENSDLYKSGNEDLNQMIGEAKCIRAMNYLDAVILWGDIPFSLTRTYDNESLVMPVASRDVILSTLIEDLRAAAPKMKMASKITEGVERCSKEFAWSLIARMSLFRGGYSLRHNDGDTKGYKMERPADYLDYYKIARTYADSVIKSGSHNLTKDYFTVFVDESNYKVATGDDPIFEIPFVQDVNGNIGYIHGPKGDESSAGGTEGKNIWGKSSGSVGLNAFYRFTFDSEDSRRNTIGYWSYSYDGTPVAVSSYNNYCNKWSKFWDESAILGKNSSDKTGVNFPYMRYADVLLMFAEADNEIEGKPTDEAKAALKAVRERAFRSANNKSDKVDAYVDAASTKEAFFDLIVKERAWEFGGENIRWKDLIRWNMYNKVVYQQFWKYYGMGCDRDDSYDYEGIFNKLPGVCFYKVLSRDSLNKYPEKYTAEKYPELASYPNKTLDVLEFFRYDSDDLTIVNLWDNFGMNVDYMPSEVGSDAWSKVTFFSWLDDETGIAKAPCRCSLRGYIYIDASGVITPASMPEFNSLDVLETLPPVRYMLPYPTDAITKSQGAYKNYYGY